MGHRRLQARRGGGYRAEVGVVAECLSDAWSDHRFEVAGRIDGVYIDSDGVTVVEEIKTTFEPPATAAADNPDHWAQLYCYGYLFCREHTLATCRLTLTYFQLDCERESNLSRDVDFDTLQTFFNAALDRYADWLCRIDRHRQQLRAQLGALLFPMPTFRGPQRTMAVAAYRACRDGAQLLIEAPTGSGKSLGALFPALKSIGAGDIDQVVFAHAKGSGAHSVSGTVACMANDVPALRALLLTAREKICPCRSSSAPPGPCDACTGYYQRRLPALTALLDEAPVVIDRQHLVDVAARHRVCPFQLGIDFSPWADLVAGDFNYLFDPLAAQRQLLDDDIRRALVIDESHNLVSRSRDMYSAVLQPTRIDTVRKASAADAPRAARALSGLRRALTRWTADVDDNAAATELGDSAAVARALDRAIGELTGALSQPQEHLFDSGWQQSLIDLLGDLLRFSLALDASADAYHLLLERAPNGRPGRVELFCVSAAAMLQQTLRRFYTVVAMSATLSPSDYYRMALGLGDDCRFLVVDSPFSPLSQGVFVTRYIDTRPGARAPGLPTLIDTLHAVVSTRPGNYLAFFSSYEYLDAARRAFVQRFDNVETIAQTPGMGEADREQFFQAFSRPSWQRPLLGFAILGGIFGEGIDLPGDRLIGVLIAGLGMPVPDSRQQAIHRWFAARQCDPFDYAYRVPGLTRAIQTAGRLVRTEHDRGVVVLLDQRYCAIANSRYLPSSWRVQSASSIDDLSNRLAQFWDAGSAAAAQPLPMADERT